MHKIHIDIEGKEYKFEHPEMFNELSEKQYTEVVCLFLLQKEIPLNDRIDDQIRLLYAFLGGFSDSKKERKEVHKVISALIKNGESEGLLKLNSFLYNEQTFNSWIIKSIKPKNTVYCGPTDRFNTMTFGEFIVADMLISAYFGSKDPEAILHKIIAVLYREKRNDLSAGFTGDIRQKFNSEYMQTREKEAGLLDDITKKAILYNFLGVRNWLSKKYIFVFTSPETSRRTNIVFGKQENSWMSIRRHLAKDVLNLEKTDQLNLHDVLSSLNEEMSKQ